MEKIVHRNINVNGINMHVADIGEGPAVLFLHGFPELWYSWRHQMLSLSAKGYRAIAPDLRGYGDTDAPPSSSSYTAFHIVGDLVGVLDELRLEMVFLVGHDWGAIIAWYLCLFRPDRIKALVNLSVVFNYFTPKDTSRKPVEFLRDIYGDDYYVCRFQEVGMEEEYEQADTPKLMTGFFSVHDPKPFLIPRAYNIAKIIESSPPPTLPPWLTDDDINYYATKFQQKGFAGGINYYRCLDLDHELTEAWRGSNIQVPVKFIIGDQDLTYEFHGMKEYIHNGEFKKEVPFLEEVVVMEGVAHFINQEKPEEISNHIYHFIQKF